VKKVALQLFKLGALAVVLFLPLRNAFADTVTGTNPAWVLLPNSIGPNTGTFALPAVVPNCGSENEPTCEPTGDFLVSSAFTSGLGTYTITDSATEGGNISDVITIANTGPGGTGEIQFFSDATLPASVSSPIFLCQEDFNTGCVGNVTLITADGATITVGLGADGQGGFDPFGFGFDSSDQIQFKGATTITGTPEPASLLLMGTGLLSLCAIVRRKYQA
jgi:hypothetical protein